MPALPWAAAHLSLIITLIFTGDTLAAAYIDGIARNVAALFELGEGAQQNVTGSPVCAGVVVAGSP
jgi:hypothetical protein